MRLSDNFTMAELTKSQTAERMSIDNSPKSDDEIINLMSLCENILEPVREEFGIPFSPSSGYRCMGLNRAIGSSDNSQHVKGEAVDFEIPGIPNFEVAQWIMDNLDYDQLILEFYKEEDPNSGWIHCSYLEDGNRNVARRFDGRNWNDLS